MRRSVLDRLAEGDLAAARSALRERAGEDGEGLADDPLLHRLWLWLDVRGRGPGHVRKALRSAGVEPGEAAGSVACLEAALMASEALVRGEVEDLTRHADAAEAADPGEDPFVGLVVASVLQAAYRFTSEPARAERAVDACLRVGDRTDAPALAIQARALAGNVRMLQGRFHEADELLLGALELARSTGRDTLPDCGMAWQFRAYLSYEWNRIDEARDLLHRAVEVGEAVGSRGILTGSYRMLSVVERAAGRLDRARSWMGRLEAFMEGPVSERNREWLAASRAGLAVATGDLRAGDAWIRRRGYRARELIEAGPAALLAALHEVTILLQVLLALDRTEEVRALASAVAAAAGDHGRLWFAARAGAVEAAALEALGEPDAAETALSRALGAGEAEGFVRAYADVGAPLLPVLERIADARPASGSVGRVLAATRATADASITRPELTEREAEVLGLLARGLSNREIGERLGLSLATVKTHLHHLYGKLGVRSRTRAVARAEALALL